MTSFQVVAHRAEPATDLAGNPQVLTVPVAVIHMHSQRSAQSYPSKTVDDRERFDGFSNLFRDRLPPRSPALNPHLC
jgi:hypothetical protein